MTPNAAVTVKRNETTGRTDPASVDRAMKALKHKLSEEGLIESIKHRARYRTPRERVKFKRSRKTGPARSKVPWKFVK